MPQEMSTAWGVMRSNDIQNVIMSTFTMGATSVMSRKSLQRHKPELSGGGGKAAKSPGSNYYAAIDLAADCTFVFKLLLVITSAPIKTSPLNIEQMVGALFAVRGR